MNRRRAMHECERQTVRVRGIVQGVGFRPHVYRLATELGLGGHVGNDADGVFIELIGTAHQRRALLQRLTSEQPPLARIDDIEHGAVTPAPRFEPFRIVESHDADRASTRVVPDTAVCADCVAELNDPSDRRFGHPFITCTNCGPRYTIITGLPYDRPRTTMAAFEMCDACRAEYADPTNRRYHAQPIGCHDCGPTLTWRVGDADHDGAVGTSDPIAAAAAMLGSGDVIAVKGLGGYHLVADATSDTAVASIRARKHRPDKPFAIMVRDLETARRIARIDDAHADLLASAAAPIVLLERRDDASEPAPLSALVAPGNPLVGVMLPYTPVHHLLFAATGLDALVVTSANHSGEPLLFRDDPETIAALGRLADGVMSHNREIRVPIDDSVVRLVAGRLLPIRVGRGYAPVVLPLPATAGAHDDVGAVLAVGGELKNTVALATGAQVWMSAHIGDMGNLETLRAFERTADQVATLTGATPTAVAHDLHPGYHTTGWARRRVDGDDSAMANRIPIQHHHAHVAAVATEHGVDRPLLGVAYDGTGYGVDGTIWGGEFLYCDGATFTRVGHLAPIQLPGGDGAITHPWRAALSHLRAAGIEWADDLAPVAAVTANDRHLFDTQLRRGFGTVTTSSMGRLFDAVASLVGIRQAITYEAQAAIELEHAARRGDPGDGYPLDWSPPARSANDDPIVLDPTAMMHAIVADLRAGVAIETIAARAHRGIAVATMRAATELAARFGCDTIALTGGVFQNALFTEWCLAAQTPAGRAPAPNIITHHLVPPNDGGLALGQAAVAVRQLGRSAHAVANSPTSNARVDMKAGSACV